MRLSKLFFFFIQYLFRKCHHQVLQMTILLLNNSGSLQSLLDYWIEMLCLLPAVNQSHLYFISVIILGLISLGPPSLEKSICSIGNQLVRPPASNLSQVKYSCSLVWLLEQYTKTLQIPKPRADRGKLSDFWLWHMARTRSFSIRVVQL